jgi:hypothetical protein
MVYLFNLWNFFQLTDQCCEFDVTMANMPRMREGTAEWISECLSAFGLNLPARSWEVMPFRSYYFSSYPYDEDWRDRWPEGWTVRVNFDSRIDVPNKPLNLPIQIDTPDTTWDGEFKDPRHNNTALLISNHRTSLTFVEQLANEIVIQAGASGKLSSQPELSIVSFGDDRHQLRIIFHGVTFPNLVDTLENLLDLCKQQGGTINWQASIT